MVKFLLSTGAGICIGFIGVVLHNFAPPFGLILALLESAVGIWILGRYWQSKLVRIPALIGWLAIILRAGTHGVSYELLVMGNNNGNIFLIGGFVLSMLMVFAKI